MVKVSNTTIINIFFITAQHLLTDRPESVDSNNGSFLTNQKTAIGYEIEWLLSQKQLIANVVIDHRAVITNI